MHQKKKNPTLPFDLIVGILLRLPVRSLLRFKCVCKSWLSLISDPQFAKSHFDLAASPTHRILTNSTRDGHKIKSLDFEASFHDGSAIINLNIPAPLLPGGAKYPKVLDSCRGFVLLANREVELIVWNPLTGVYKRIPNLLYYETCHFLYGIGYDSSMDDYLVVFMQLIYPGQKLHYFSLKTNAWSDAQYIDVQYACISFGLFLNGAGLFLNGALHWLFLSLHTLLYVIIVFDLMERSLSEIPLPHDLDMVITSKDYYLRVMGECLGLCYLGVGYTEIWVMKEYKVHSSWTKSFVFSTYDIPRNIFLPICITKCGEIFGSNGWRTLVKFNDRGKLLEHGTLLQETGIFSQLHYHIYRESLLSLPSYSEEASKNDQQ